MRTIRATDLAAYVVWYAAQKRIRITHLKLQKMLYYIQGYHMQKFSQPLFSDKICAWQYGPVVPAVYREYFVNGTLPLLPALEKVSLPLETRQMNLINRVIEIKGTMPASQLVAATHKEPPWANLSARVLNGEHPEIPQRAIQQYFSSLRELT